MQNPADPTQYRIGDRVECFSSGVGLLYAYTGVIEELFENNIYYVKFDNGSRDFLHVNRIKKLRVVQKSLMKKFALNQPVKVMCDIESLHKQGLSGLQNGVVLGKAVTNNTTKYKIRFDDGKEFFINEHLIKKQASFR